MSRRRVSNLQFGCALMLLATAPGLGGGSGGYEMDWHCFDAGGAVSTGGAFTMIAAIGEHDAGNLSGGAFVLAGGVLAGFDDAPSPCTGGTGAADLDCDGVVNTLDLGILLSGWTIPPQTSACGGATPCPADINGDGVVNTLDLGILLSSWTL
jgi:hypothetical protein